MLRPTSVFLFFGLLWSTTMTQAQRDMKKLLDFEIMPITRLTHPDYLKKGDLVLLVAPAGIVHSKDPVFEAVKLLESWGLRAEIAPHVFEDGAHFAGSDAMRLQDLQMALDHPSAKAIWAVRGGYGSARIVDDLDFTKFKENPKWLIGYSDITALHSAIHLQGIESMHAMMASNLKEGQDSIQTTINSFKETLMGKRPNYSISSHPNNKKGSAKGQLVGGNLTLLQTQIGTPTDLDTSGKIIFFEEVGEYKYHLDRMIRQLERRGYFKECEGVIVGDISRVKHNSTVFGLSTEELILDILKDYDFPIIFNFPAGHEPINMALILGREVKIDANTKGKSTVKFKL